MSSSPEDYLRPDDRDLIRSALRSFARSTGAEVMLGGLVQAGSLTLTEFVGNRGDSLRNVTLQAGAGLGGTSMRRGAHVAVADYLSATGITHQFDRAVRKEGLRSVTAVPVMVTGHPRCVIYAASRTPGRFGDRVTTALGAEARRIAAELSTRDEVDRRVSMLSIARAGDHRSALDSTTIARAHAELRALARSLDDPATAARIAEVAGLLVPSADEADALTLHPLTERERDVVGLAALGCSNAEIAERLSIRITSVKKYMQNAMRKLGTSRRLEAVIRARHLRLIP